MREAEALAAAERARQDAERARRERERNLFTSSVGPVRPMKPSGRAQPSRTLPSPEPRQRELDEQAALREALSDEVDVESLLLTDDGLSYRRPDVSEAVLAKLRKGHWSIQGELDLHGMRRDEARDTLSDFIRLAHQHSRRCLRVVHGKGHGSPGREPVLKSKVQRWLAQRREVIAFAQAAGPQGGAGALIVLLGSRDGQRPGQRRAPQPENDMAQHPSPGVFGQRL
ncbi:MAG TPA: Smr/MutS family protein [Ideonella sp.]|nr:Smr/MutS family protein [Ideonella sp.]HSI47145.1 Smr/MutS family protein [Ideonella sp.]